MIDARRIDADLELLGYVLDHGYVGRHVVPDASYQAMQHALDALRGSPRTVGALCDALGDAL